MRSERPAGEKSSVKWIDLMGLTGILLEAAEVGHEWAGRLKPAEATRAARYATLEFRFPRWLPELCARWPTETGDVLMAEILDEIQQPGRGHFTVLSAVQSAGEPLAKLMTPLFLDHLEIDTPISAPALTAILKIILAEHGRGHRARLLSLALRRFRTEQILSDATPFLAAAFSCDPEAAAAALLKRATEMEHADRAKLITEFLEMTFNGAGWAPVFPAPEVPPAVLESLVRLDLDNPRPESTRRTELFSRFLRAPGPGIYHALRRLEAEASAPKDKQRFNELAEERAVRDADISPWPPREVVEFERSHQRAPATGKELQELLLRRIEDMQHELVNGDFAQGPVLKACPNEKAVQEFIAERLRQSQGRSYSLEREPEVIARKKPDIRARATRSDEAVAIEIKVAESWDFDVLITALENQLCGQYLRSIHGRHGILLVVHQNPDKKPDGWRDTMSATHMLSVGQVIERLRFRAADIRATGHDGPQPEIAFIDVSHCEDWPPPKSTPRPRKKKAKK